MGLLDALVLGSSVLEPDFYLRFAETKRRGQFGASRARNIFGRLELDFEAQRLLLRERRPLASLTQTLALPPGH